MTFAPHDEYPECQGTPKCNEPTCSTTQTSGDCAISDTPGVTTTTTSTPHKVCSFPNVSLQKETGHLAPRAPPHLAVPLLLDAPEPRRFDAAVPVSPTLSDDESAQPPQPDAGRRHRQLGIIFDIDGTLIAEGENIRGVKLRPGTIECLHWLWYERQHALAIWTAGWSAWAHRVCTEVCERVQQYHYRQLVEQRDAAQDKDKESELRGSCSPCPTSENNPGNVDIRREDQETKKHNDIVNKVSGSAEELETITFDPHHKCSGVRCRRTFSFVWDMRQLRCQERLAEDDDDDDDDSSTELLGGLRPHTRECQWCDFYSPKCQRCGCVQSNISFCPCRYTKDLEKVWYERKRQEQDRIAQAETSADQTDGETAPPPRLGKNSPSWPGPEFGAFVPARTLLVENTPQQCKWNYANAIYIPTYRGGMTPTCQDEERGLWERFRKLILLLEEADDVRLVPKCSHRVKGPHACFSQDWWAATWDPHPGIKPKEEKEASWISFCSDAAENV